MLTTEREKRICDKYGKRDSEGKVHCNECPLSKGGVHCKANSHYDRRTREWEFDEWEFDYE